MKTALVTGASCGLGRALAQAFTSDGYSLILSGRNAAALMETAELCLPAMPVLIVGDLRDVKTRDDLTEAAAARGIDVLVNNAGMYSHGEPNPQKIVALIETNLLAPMLLTYSIYPLMVERGSGTVVNINSVAGKHAHASEAVYAASKHGLYGFSKALRQQGKPQGIRVIDVFPGALNSRMLDHRTDLSTCIDVAEAADLIVSLTRDYSSFQINEIDLSRRLD